MNIRKTFLSKIRATKLHSYVIHTKLSEPTENAHPDSVSNSNIILEGISTSEASLLTLLDHIPIMSWSNEVNYKRFNINTTNPLTAHVSSSAWSPTLRNLENKHFQLLPNVRVIHISCSIRPEKYGVKCNGYSTKITLINAWLITLRKQTIQNILNIWQTSVSNINLSELTSYMCWLVEQFYIITHRTKC
jgi:hypothetical protein